jgi:hypothetical protein
MTVDIYAIDIIARVLEPSIIARPPNTPDQWNAYSVRFCEAAGIRENTSQGVSWLDQSNVNGFVENVNLIKFLEEAQKLHHCHLQNRTGTDSVISFWDTLLSGLGPDYGKDAGIEPLIGHQLIEQGAILLGQLDIDADVPPSVSSLARITAQAIGVPDPLSASAMAGRAHMAPALYLALRQVLAPHGSDIRSGFYVTEAGLCGLCLPGAREGDIIARIFRGTTFEIPMVLRPVGEKRYLMVCAAGVSSGWEEVCKRRKTVDREEVVIV